MMLDVRSRWRRDAAVVLTLTPELGLRGGGVYANANEWNPLALMGFPVGLGIMAGILTGMRRTQLTLSWHYSQLLP